MNCKSTLYKISFLVIAALFAMMSNSFAQNNEHTIDSVMAYSPDYLPTLYGQFPTTNFKPLIYKSIDTALFKISEYDELWKLNNLYQSTGINGQAHKSMIFNPQRPDGFTMIRLPYPLYFKTINDLRYYNLKTSHTNINFTYGILDELKLNATHTQHIRQVDFTLDLNAMNNSGYFIHQGINQLTLDGIFRYETPKKIYGFSLAYILNHAKLSENGGLEYSPNFTDRTRRDENFTNNLSSFPVMFSNAQSLINQHSAQLMNYVNLKSPKGHYYGTITHTANFDFLKSTFTDHELNNLFYVDKYYESVDSTNDSIQYFSISNSLQWSNFTPNDTIGDQSYFFRIAGGLRHEYVNALRPNYIGNTLSLFGRTGIRLFKVWDIYGDIAFSLFGYNKYDASATAGATFSLNRKQGHKIGVEASFDRFAPDYIFSYYLGNNNLWLNELSKQNFFSARAWWTIFNYKISLNFFNLNRYVYLNNNFVPVQEDEAFNVLQMTLLAPIHTKHFSFETLMALQYSTNTAVSLPLFAVKAGAAYNTEIFRKRLKFQIGIDIFYNTSYFSDGYDPIIHQFYAQQYLKTGNYLYVNAHAAFRVRRLSFFVRGGNLIAGLFSFKYITTPGYPMQGRNLEVGISWKFYD